MQGLNRQFGLPVPDRSVTPGKINLDNSKIVGLDDDLQAAYDWLKSSDRDGQMGALADDNRRTLILAPGQHAITGNWEVDTDYVDISSLTGSHHDTVVYRSGITDGQEVIDITATGGICTFYGFRIDGKLGNGDGGGGRGVTFNACTYGTAGQITHSGADFILQETGCGTPYTNAVEAAHCRAFVYKSGTVNPSVGICKYASGITGDNLVWVLNANPGEDTNVTWGVVRMPLFVNMYFNSNSATEGRSGYVAPNAGGGIFINCRGPHGWPTHDLSAKGSRFECYDCVGPGDGCFGGDNSSGGWDMSYYSGCIGGTGAFAGCNAWGSNFGGFAINCIGDSGCFAIGREFAGTAINCHVGGKGFAGYGAGSNYGTFSGVARNCSAGKNSFGQGHASCTFSGIAVNCLKAITGAVTDSYKMAQENIITDMVGTAMGEVGAFTGKTRGCGPVGPVTCTSAQSLEAWDSGTTFNNAGAGGAVKLTLPAATVGLKFKFYVAAAQQLQIEPDGTETLNNSVGRTQLAAGEYMYADAVGEFAEIECFVAGQWECTAVNGTWHEETP